MAESSAGRITSDLLSEPHIAGRRISVRQVYDWVEGRGLSPQQVADRFDLDVADIYSALAYYHDHPADMKRVREERERAFESAKRRAEADRPTGVEPPGE
jgi:uncharacterized protein (DUF433 family)